MEKQILVKGEWYPITRETQFNGVLHYGVCTLNSKGEFRLGWVPAWLVDEVKEG